MKSRREFLMNAALAAGVGAAAGCVTRGGGSVGTGGAPMYDFACAPLKEIRIGLVGLGERGLPALKRLSGLPGVKIAAICDNVPEKVSRARAELAKKGAPAAKEFGGEEGWKALCDWDGIDVVYNATPWSLHAPIGVYAMKAGKHVMIEVPAALYLDDCWELVETAEKTRRHCMQLENCLYGEAEMLGLVMCREKIFGELLYGECGYLHDRREGVFSDVYTDHWRLWWNVRHRGDQYPTHGIGPLCRYLDINCGDRLDYLVCVDTKQVGYEAYGREKFPGTWKARQRFETGDATFTTIKTAKGRCLVIKHDTTSPRPYTRINRIQGTKGVFEGSCVWDPKEKNSWPLRMCFDNGKGWDDGNHWLEGEALEQVRRKYRHPLWKAAGEYAAGAGGHGGMDFLMDLSWTYALQHGLPLDQDVYDLATWCSVCEASERSVRSGSMPEKLPDFTRGAWERLAPKPIREIPFKG